MRLPGGRQVIVRGRSAQAGADGNGEGPAAVRHRHFEQRVVPDDGDVPQAHSAQPGGGRAQRRSP